MKNKNLQKVNQLQVEILELENFISDLKSMEFIDGDIPERPVFAFFMKREIQVKFSFFGREFFNTKKYKNLIVPDSMRKELLSLSIKQLVKYKEEFNTFFNSLTAEEFTYPINE